MVIRSVELETVCGITSALPEHTLPEVAFAGKSNVGKSSLINGLMNRKHLARVSEKPGKTQTINYYNINNECYFVDLPGYGFAHVPEEVRREWGRMVERYLNSSPNLIKVFLLVDIRHDPSANDRQMAQWIIAQGYEPVIIATKSDKIKRSRHEEHIAMLRRGLEVAADTPVFPYSALSKEGRDEIYAYLDGLLGNTDEQQEE